MLKSYDRVLIPEMNLGQLLQLVRAKYLVDAVGYNRVTGKPFKAGRSPTRSRRCCELSFKHAEGHVFIERRRAREDSADRAVPRDRIDRTADLMRHGGADCLMRPRTRANESKFDGA